MLAYSDQEQESGIAGRGVRVPSREEPVSKEQLHVVVQNGRLFQQHHPDATVIHDRGRFLLVKLDPELGRELERKHETCYGVMPLSEDQVVFDEPARTAARAPVAFIQNLADQPKRENLEANLEKLVSFSTRHSTSSEYSDASAWTRKQLTEMGYKTRMQTIAVNGGKSRNIVADKRGSGSGKRNIVIATAHLDSINLQGGPSAPAPGADDNGSGSAGILEIARAFQSHNGVHDLRLILFGGEEQGLFGSRHYVATLPAAQRGKIRAVINMDMIGRLNSPSRSVLLEGAALSQSVIDGLSQSAATYTELVVETSLNPFASDHVPFIRAGIPAVLTIEGSDNTNGDVHSSKDTIDKISYDFAIEILRMNIAFLGSEIGEV
jgi:hypothetical protein